MAKAKTKSINLILGSGAIGMKTGPKKGNIVTPKTGSGDYYGSGVKNPTGRVRAGTVGINPISKKGLKKPPKSLA